MTPAILADRAIARPAGGVALAVLARRWWPVWLGLASLLLPTLHRLAIMDWSGQLGAFHLITLVLGAWLIAREWPDMAAAAQPAPALPVGLLFAGLVPVYLVARSIELLSVESLAVYLLSLTTLFALVGVGAMKRAWFALAFPLFALPVESLLGPGTEGLRLWLCDVAVRLLHGFGLPVGSIGQTIYVGSIEIVMLEACAGLGSIFSLGAIGLFYIYVVRRPSPLYVAAMALLMVALAIVANLARILILLLLTHYAGNGVAQGFLHEAAGMTTFTVAVGALILADTLIWPFAARMRWVHG